MEPGSLVDYEGFASHVFKGRRHGRSVAMKLSHSSSHSRGAIEAELEFVRQLAAAGVQLAPALVEPDSGDRPVLHAIPDQRGGVFYAYGFEWIEGECFEDVEKTPEQLLAAGRNLGALHAVSAALNVQGRRLDRHGFEDNDDYDYRTYLPPRQRRVIRRMDQIMARVREQPRDAQRFGLIHSDCHDGNWIVDRHGRPRLIDFDDCEYHFFLYDIAIMVYTFLPPDEWQSRAWSVHVFRQLVKGYRQSRELDADEFAAFPLFLKFRALMIHVLLAKVARLTGERPDAVSERRRIARFESNFEDLAELMDLDYVSLARSSRG